MCTTAGNGFAFAKRSHFDLAGLELEVSLSRPFKKKSELMPCTAQWLRYLRQTNPLSLLPSLFLPLQHVALIQHMRIVIEHAYRHVDSNLLDISVNRI
jgi:hypothetical protein